MEVVQFFHFQAIYFILGQLPKTLAMSLNLFIFILKTSQKKSNFQPKPIKYSHIISVLRSYTKKGATDWQRLTTIPQPRL